MVAAFLLVLVFLDTAATGWLYAMQREQHHDLVELHSELQMVRAHLDETSYTES